MKRPANIFYGWWIVAISLVVDALGAGTFHRGFTLYFLPLQKDLGLSSTRFSLAQTLGRLEGGVQGPVVGYLTDRLGASTMMVAGGAALGLGFILLYFTHNYLYFLLVFVGLLSVGARLGYNNASTAAVNQWFRRKRGLAMSIVSTGQGLGGAAIVPLVALMVTGLSWRTSALVSGIAVLAVVVPLSLLVRRSPESMGLLPDGDRTKGPHTRLGTPGSQRNPPNPRDTRTPAAGQPSVEADFTAREAMRTSSYWLFVLAAGLRDAAHSGIQWHLARLIVMTGASLRASGFLIGFMSFTTIIFNPCFGWLGDKWPKQKISAVAMIGGALAMILLLYSSGQAWQMVVFVILLALSETSNFLTWAIMGDFFGRRSYATLRGWQHLPNQLMAMGTPLWMGWVFDRTDSLTWAVIPLAVLYGLAAFFYWTLRRPIGKLEHRG